MKIITTSWDDGYPLDTKVADLLLKYDLPGTFYIPRSNKEHMVMEENYILELSNKFEIGGHTLNHVRLNHQPANILETEIKGCHTWLYQLLGCKPISFCFPGGIFDSAAITKVYEAGFKLIRSTELLSISAKSRYNLVPTTIQLFDHNRSSYFKNILKRRKIKSLILWLSTNCTNDILKLIDFYIEYIIKNDGCFHLWGHSWEIDKYQLWNKLEYVFAHISRISEFKYIPNRDVISPNA